MSAAKELIRVAIALKPFHPITCKSCQMCKSNSNRERFLTHSEALPGMSENAFG